MNSPSSELVEKLEQAVEELQVQVQRVEIWAGALGAFTRPIPTYTAPDDHLISSSSDGQEESGTR